MADTSTVGLAVVQGASSVQIGPSPTATNMTLDLVGRGTLGTRAVSTSIENVPLSLVGYSGQTAPLVSYKDSLDNEMSFVDAYGGFMVGTRSDITDIIGGPYEGLALGRARYVDDATRFYSEINCYGLNSEDGSYGNWAFIMQSMEGRNKDFFASDNRSEFKAGLSGCQAATTITSITDLGGGDVQFDLTNPTIPLYSIDAGDILTIQNCSTQPLYNDETYTVVQQVSQTRVRATGNYHGAATDGDLLSTDIGQNNFWAVASKTGIDVNLISHPMSHSYLVITDGGVPSDNQDSFRIQVRLTDTMKIGSSGLVSAPGVSLTSDSATRVPVIVKANAVQSANLTDWQDSAANTLSYITKDGAFTSIIPDTMFVPGGIGFMPQIDVETLEVVEIDGSANTGTDASFSHTYEAIKIANPGNNTCLGFIEISLKASVAMLGNGKERITFAIYADAAGVPGSAVTAFSDVGSGIYYSSISDNYESFYIPLQFCTSSDAYFWVVMQRTAAPSGGTVYLDSGTTGTGLHAYSSDGVAWTAENNKQCYFNYYMHQGGPIYSYTGGGTAIYGDALGSVGVMGRTEDGFGVAGSAFGSGAGVRGYSPNGTGVVGYSQLGRAGIFTQYAYYGSGQTANSPTLYVSREATGATEAGSTIGNVIEIVDNPPLSGTISGSIIKATVGSTVRLDMNPRVTDGASAKAYIFDTHTSLANASAKIASFGNAGSEKVYIDKDGGIGLKESDGDTYYTILKAGNQSGDITYTLPTAAPSANGQISSSTTAGIVSWINHALGPTFWTEVTGTTQAMAVNKGYIANNASQVVFTLPATASVGDTVKVMGKGAGGWRVGQNAGQMIYMQDESVVTTTGVSGYVEPTSIETTRMATIELVCTVTDTTWTVMAAIGSMSLN